MKFRAFVKEGMCHTDAREDDFIPEDEIIWYLDYAGISVSTFDLIDSLVNGEHEQEAEYVRHEEYPIMQYIGLKDKQGVEIYECDILKVASNGYANYISAYGDNCKVEYNEDRCGYIATTGNGYDTRNAFDLNCDAEIEVIGNIYENPELYSFEG